MSTDLMPGQKYQPFAFAPPPFNRTWCNNTLARAPIWASVDLRDGNQALVNPMTLQQKLAYFKLLVDIGFKEIEIGFPSASSVEFEFTRTLIENKLIPDDVTVQVLVQARLDLIERTFLALAGARCAIVHVYNSTSKVQREKVYQKSQSDIIKMATDGATWIKQIAKRYPDTEWIFQYSPESFSQTEPDFAVDICQAVCGIWQNDVNQNDEKIPNNQAVIINLPATVEASSPNIFADQVEYFCQNLPNRDKVIISLHTHNDRGCAIAAAELGLLAGADRIEGTLFGNGERTGNMDIVAMALNFYTQGIDPKLDFSNLMPLAEHIKACTELPIHPRHPYVGELVFTAFSGSHQDAINKSLAFDKAEQSQAQKQAWNVAYLPIDPKDLGRTYEGVVRINSQSGKGGAAYILQQFGFFLPKFMQAAYAKKVQNLAEQTARELSADELLAVLNNNFTQNIHKLDAYTLTEQGGASHFSGTLTLNASSDDAANAHITNAAQKTLIGSGTGSLSAFIDSLSVALPDFNGTFVANFEEHTLKGAGASQTEARAVAYVQLQKNDQSQFGIGIDENSTQAAFKAVLAAFKGSAE